MDPGAAIITGASSGIGLATALRLARDGWRLVLIARGEPGLERAAAAVREAGSPEASWVSADVADRPAIESALATAADRLGGVDLVVANAGSGSWGTFRETPAEDFDRVIAVSFGGIVNTVRAALPDVERAGGAIVVTGSAAADLPLPLLAAYTASQNAVRGFVDVLRIELRADGSPIRLALVEPGPVNTPYWDNATSQRDRLPPRFPLSYDADEVARAIVFAANHGNGRLPVGGMTALATAAYRLTRPLAEEFLAAGTRVVKRLGPPSSGSADTLREPTGSGELSAAGGRGRPSALIRLASGAERVGSRLLG